MGDVHWRELVREVVDSGLVGSRPGGTGPVAMDLLVRLFRMSRRRWPADTSPEEHRAPALLPVVP